MQSRGPSPVPRSPYPLRDALALRFAGGRPFDGATITVAATELPWFLGLLDGARAAATTSRDHNVRDLNKVIEFLSDGHTIDLWIEC